jgi:hypothetical protein
MWPIRYPSDVPVFYRIEMNVIGVAGKISVIAQCVLPIAALPNAALFIFRRGSVKLVRRSADRAKRPT